MDKKYKQVEELNNYLKEKLSKLDNVHINSNEYSLPHILNFSVVGKNPNEIQELLSEKDICISTQTACATGSNISPSVLALTNNKEYASSSLRVSISHLTTKEELDIFIRELSKIIGSDK